MDNIPFRPSIFRQPPPPPTPHHPPAARSEGKIKPEMVAGNSCSTHTRKRLTEIESLPKEVLFDVLVRLHAQDIYDSARLVCTKWYHMIHTHAFVYTHLRHSTYGLLFQSTSRGHSFFMSVGESGRVEIDKHSYKLKGPLIASCNGLLLELELKMGVDKYNLYVSNPTTRQIFFLPPFVGRTIDYGLFGIAYAAATMEYKAVALFTTAQGMKKIFMILTTGVDHSWRTIGKESISLAASPMFVSPPLITEGFMHFYHMSMSSDEVLTLNLETEIITETSGPTPKGKRNQLNTYLSTGRYLSLLRPCGDFCWEVWEMKPKIDYEWRKVCDISLETYKRSTFQPFGFDEYTDLIPIGWLKYLELLVFSVSSPCRDLIFVFNLLTQGTVTIEVP